MSNTKQSVYTCTDLKQFYKRFNNMPNDKEKWKLVFANNHLDFEVIIDNDEIIIPTLTEGYLLDFDNYGTSAIYDILTAQNINADFV